VFIKEGKGEKAGLERKKSNSDGDTTMPWQTLHEVTERTQVVHMCIFRYIQ
jgi:hypothetical protein